jgi:hypothetical protein
LPPVECQGENLLLKYAFRQGFELIDATMFEVPIAALREGATGMENVIAVSSLGTTSSKEIRYNFGAST